MGEVILFDNKHAQLPSGSTGLSFSLSLHLSYLRNKFNFWNVHRIMNTVLRVSCKVSEVDTFCLLQSKCKSLAK